MAIAFDAATRLASTGNTNMTLSHTIGAGSNMILLVGIGTNTAISCTGVTYNGVAMTQIGSPIDNTNSGANSRLYVFYILAPAAGAHNIVSSWSGPSTARTMFGVSYSGVDQTTPFGTTATSTTNNSTAPSVTVTSAAGELCVDFQSAHSTLTSLSATAGQTSRQTQTTTLGMGCSEKAGAASTTMSWSNSAARWYSSRGIPLKPAGGNTAFTQNLGGSLTPTGAVQKAVSASKTGSLTPTGVVRKAISKALGGGITPAGALIKAMAKSLAGAMTPSGSIAKAVSAAKGGSLTPTGTIRKAITKSFAGGITPSGALQALKVILLSLAGSVGLSGVIVKAISATKTGSLTPGGIVRKAVAKSFGGSLTPSGSLASLRLVLLSLAGAVTPIGSVSKNVSKSLTATLAPIGTVAKSIAKTLTGFITAAGELITEVFTPVVPGQVSVTVSLVNGLAITESSQFAVSLRDSLTAFSTSQALRAHAAGSDATVTILTGRDFTL